jgi:predicted TIM-barrel enzyme
VLERTRGVAGFFGASSIERLATETAIEQQARSFKSIRIPT